MEITEVMSDGYKCGKLTPGILPHASNEVDGDLPTTYFKHDSSKTEASLS
jgi:hypothetical protein